MPAEEKIGAEMPVEVEIEAETEEVEIGAETAEEVDIGAETAELVESGAETAEEVDIGAETAEEVDIGAETAEVETEMPAEVEIGAKTAEVESGAEMPAETEITMPAEVEIGVEMPAELQLRWPFIRKVCSIIAVQLLLTIAVASVAASVPPIARFFFSSITGLGLYIFLIFLPVLRFCPLRYYSVLFIFTVAVAFTTRLDCALQSRKVILEEVILTTAVVLGLTLSIFWATRIGNDFNFLRPFLSAAFVVSILFAFIQTMHPLDKSSVMMYSCLASIIYGGYIIYDTDNIIKRLSYDQLIWASFSLYMDIMQLVQSPLTLFTRSI